MSACDDCRSLVPIFLDDELTGKDADDFREHLAGCAACREFLAQERALSELLHRVRPLYEAPEALRTRVSGILSSGIHSDLAAPERLRQRILRMTAFQPGNASRPVFRWTQLAVVGG